MPGEEFLEHRAEQERAAALEGALVAAHPHLHAATEGDRTARGHATRDRGDPHGTNALEVSAQHGLVVAGIEVEHLAQRQRAVLLADVGKRKIIERKMADAAPGERTVE